MSNQSTTTNAPTEPQLCKMGCGFFGSNATGDCCSKCYRELLKKEGNDSVAQAPQPVVPQEAAVNPPSPAVVEPTPVVAPPSDIEMEEVIDTAPKVERKKKKKKTSYKAMMASMTQRTKDEADIEKEKEGLRKVTGGGTFSKIDKI